MSEPHSEHGARGAPPGDGAMAIVAREVRVVRGETEVLRGLDLRVPRGCVYGLVGPSGSGKTTLIRAIVGLQRLTGGAIAIDGIPAGTAALRGAIGYMPQSPAIYEDLSARENLRFFAAVYRVPPARVEETLRLVDLAEIADRSIATYSGGQRQRVSLAAAILPAPRLILLDEPTVGLDPRLRHHLWSRFHAWAAGGATVLVTTHVMDEAARTDRLAFLAAGLVVAEGSPEELRARAGAADLEEAVLRLTESGAAPPQAVGGDAYRDGTAG